METHLETAYQPAHGPRPFGETKLIELPENGNILKVKTEDGVEEVLVTLQEGLSEEDAAELVRLTATSLRVHKYTNDLEKNGQPGRFADIEQIKKWYEKPRFVFLLKRGDTILGITWYRVGELPQNNDRVNIEWQSDVPDYMKRTLKEIRKNPDICDTYAIRAYGERMGVGKKLTEEVIRVWKERNKGQERHLWLEVLETNETAIRLYKDHGFEQVATKTHVNQDGSVERQLVMLLRSES